MKFYFKKIVLLCSVIGLFMIFSCSRWNGEVQEFYAKYRVYGGFAGINWTTVEIFKDGYVIYTGYGQNGLESYSGQIDSRQSQIIYSTFMDNAFLNLDSCYFTYPCYDDFTVSLTLKTDTDSHRVIANMNTIEHSILSWKWKFKAISDSMYNLVDLVRTDVEQGQVEISRSYPIFQWPYEDRFSIVSEETRWIEVDQDIYDYVDSINKIGQCVSYSFIQADSLIYRVKADTSRSLRIYYPFKPIKWFLDTELSEIGDEALIIYDEDFMALRDSLDSNNFRYFYDSLSSENATLYTIKLTQGNYF